MKDLKLVSWNVNGLRACVGKGFYESMAALNADAICLQEIKLQKNQCDACIPGYEAYFNYADKKGYSGTAIFTRVKPLSVAYGMGIDEHDHEGRLITAEFEKFILVCCYTPNAQDGLRRLDYRMRWEDDLRAYLQALEARKPVVLCGDLNVAHNEIDLKNPRTNHMNPGFTDQEREKLTRLMDCGYIDTFRHFFPDAKEQYSWWSYIGHARERNTGWRIDYFLASGQLKPLLAEAGILQEIMGSDHCPVTLTLNA